MHFNIELHKCSREACAGVQMMARDRKGHYTAPLIVEPRYPQPRQRFSKLVNTFPPSPHPCSQSWKISSWNNTDPGGMGAKCSRKLWKTLMTRRWDGGTALCVERAKSNERLGKLGKQRNKTNKALPKESKTKASWGKWGERVMRRGAPRDFFMILTYDTYDTRRTCFFATTAG